jgi:hypothetical protein
MKKYQVWDKRTDKKTFSYFLSLAFIKDFQRGRWDAKKKRNRTLQKRLRLLPYNVRLTSEARPATAGWRDACWPKRHF